MRAQRFYVERRGTGQSRGVASGCALFRGKNIRESAVGTRKVSAVRNLEVVASRRYLMYYINGIFSIRDCHSVRCRGCVRFSECPLREVLLYSQDSKQNHYNKKYFAKLKIS